MDATEVPEKPMGLRVAWKQSHEEILGHFRPVEIEEIMNLSSDVSAKIETLLRERKRYYSDMMEFNKKSLTLNREVETLQIEIENLETKLAIKPRKAKKWKKKYYDRVLAED